jgi:coenzyme F420-0:L-glutamate ligase / coenzyme F420-1:gamma-L-glutamate ligase
MPLILTPLPGIPLIKSGDNLIQFILESLAQAEIDLVDGDILMLAQKIVSKSEGRWMNLAQVQPSERAKDLANEIEKDARLIELILQESRSVLRTRPGTIIVEHRLGFICANAGIDHSNVAGEGNPAEEWVLLLPQDPDKSAALLRDGIKVKTGANIGVMIIDSHGRAWRLGVVGTTIGISGVPGLVDLRGEADLFGYSLRITQIAAADELAAAASLVMGQAAEGTPVVHVRGFPYPLRQSSLGELIRPQELDMFR